MVPFSLLLSFGLEGLRTEGEIELGWIIFNVALIKVKVCPKPWGLVTVAGLVFRFKTLRHLQNTGTLEKVA